MKRFTETTKWSDPWFMDLPVKYKLFWLYICDQCDWAGFWEPNMRLAIAQIGEPMELVEIQRVFEKRIEQIPNGKLWIRKFIEFQQGPELNPANNAHRGILELLNANKVSSPVPVKEKPIAPDKGQMGGYQAPDKGLASPPVLYSNVRYSTKRGSTEGEKQKAPIYDKLPPKRTPTDAELANAQRIAREETEKFRAKLRPT